MSTWHDDSVNFVRNADNAIIVLIFISEIKQINITLSFLLDLYHLFHRFNSHRTLICPSRVINVIYIDLRFDQTYFRSLIIDYQSVEVRVHLNTSWIYSFLEQRMYNTSLIRRKQSSQQLMNEQRCYLSIFKPQNFYFSSLYSILYSYLLL